MSSKEGERNVRSFELTIESHHQSRSKTSRSEVVHEAVKKVKRSSPSPKGPGCSGEGVFEKEVVGQKEGSCREGEDVGSPLHLSEPEGLSEVGRLSWCVDLLGNWPSREVGHGGLLDVGREKDKGGEEGS